MLKKIFITATALLATTSIAFAHAKNYKDYKDQAPLQCPTYEFTAAPYLGLSIGSRTNFAPSGASYHGFEGTLSAGYAAMLNPDWYLAGEVFVGDSANIDNFRDASGDGVRTSWNYGLSLIPGYMITNHVLGYVRVGAQRARFSTEGTSKTGWHTGVGLQTNLYSNWDLRGEYVFSKYASISGLGKPRSNQFNLGLVYKFL